MRVIDAQLHACIAAAATLDNMLKLPRPTAFSLNRRLWDFLCNWAFMTCCEVSVAMLRTLGIHEIFDPGMVVKVLS